MKIIGCDLHASQQTIAMLDRDTGEVVEQTLKHEGETVREFYAALPAPVVVGIEATGSMGWFLQADGRARDHVPRGSSGDDPQGRDAETETRSTRCALLLQLLTENRFPAIWMPSTELRDLRAPTAPSSVGADADARAERAARDGAGSRRASRRNAVESRRPGSATPCRWPPTPAIVAMNCWRCIGT